MKRTALIVSAVVIAAALAITTTRPTAPPRSSTSSATSAPAAGPAAAPPTARISRADVQDQDDRVTAAERGRIHRDRLLDATLVTAAAARGVSILTGPARITDRAPQDMVVTPNPDLTIREIATAVSRICRALNDPCVRRDYRFLIQTPTGRALLPARLIHPKD